jgi:hypothetical protein
MSHPAHSELSLYASRDLSPVRRVILRAHLTGCAECRGWVRAYNADRESIRHLGTVMPKGVNWDRLALEMAANVRVGLAAGECVTPQVRKPALAKGWRVAAVTVGIIVLLLSAWWLNMPRAESIALGRVVKKIAHARPWRGGILALEDRGPLLEISAAGIKIQQNGGTLGMSQGKERPVSVTLSVQGSARARYIDADTGQVTITGVYAR